MLPENGIWKPPYSKWNRIPTAAPPILLEGQLFIESFRNVDEIAICIPRFRSMYCLSRSGSCIDRSLSVISRSRRCVLSAAVAVCCCLALCKLLIFYHYIRGEYSLSVLVRIFARLDPAGDNDLCSLAQILLCELGTSSKCDAADKISGLCVRVIVVPAYSAVDCYRLSGICLLVSASCTVSDIRVPGQAAH